MELAIVEIDFKGKKYAESIPFIPSRQVEKIPPKDLQAWREINPEGVKLFEDIARQKKLRQVKYLNSALTGRLGEKILKDYLTDNGYTVKPGELAGDLFADQGEDHYLIEVKTTGRKRQMQIRREEILKNMATGRALNRVPVIYVIWLRLLRIEKPINRKSLIPSETKYIYRVDAIRNITNIVRESDRKGVLINVERNKVFYCVQKGRKFPSYFFH